MASLLNDGRLATLKRRALTVPAPFILLMLTLVLFPLGLAIAAGLDLSRGRKPVLTQTWIFCVWFSFCECWGVAGTLFVWLISLRPKGLSPEFFHEANVRLQAVWCNALYYGGARIFGFKTVVHGELPASNAPLLVFVRHASTVDTIIPICLLSTPRRLRPRIVFKRELLFDPCLDIVCNRMPNRFVRRGGKSVEEEVDGLVRLMDGMGPRDMLMIFPEGTRFTPRKRAERIARLRERGPSDALSLAESLSHTLSPLRSGPLALLEHNPGCDLVFLGHTGLEDSGSLHELRKGGLSGRIVDITLHHVPYAQVPRDPALTPAWLGERWREIDAFIAARRGAGAGAGANTNTNA